MPDAVYHKVGNTQSLILADYKICITKCRVLAVIWSVLVLFCHHRKRDTNSIL